MEVGQVFPGTSLLPILLLLNQADMTLTSPRNFYGIHEQKPVVGGIPRGAKTEFVGEVGGLVAASKIIQK